MISAKIKLVTVSDRAIQSFYHSMIYMGKDDENEKPLKQERKTSANLIFDKGCAYRKQKAAQSLLCHWSE